MSNPFKMWGSYVGAVIVWFLFWLSAKLGSDSVLFKIVNYSLDFIKYIVGCSGFSCLSYIIPILIIYTIIGFLLGWEIHSLMRKK